MENKIMHKLLDKIESNISVGDMLNLSQYGIALKVLEDMMFGIDNEVSQRCNELLHKIFD